MPADADLRTHRARARLLVALAIACVFFPLFNADFSWWDDQKTLHQNVLFNPPSFQTLAVYWSAPAMGLYVPVTQTVWAAIAKVAYLGRPDEYNISLNPTLFHATNISLHVLCAWMVYALLRRLLDATPVAACLGALFFALHPLQVESVAWISGMKDLLCWTATLAVVSIYVRRVQAIQLSGAPLWSGGAMPLAMLVLALGILSKPTAMVAPAALLAIDGLLLRRRWVRPAIELLPLFAISAAGAAIARVAQVVSTTERLPLWQRPLIVGDTFAFYLAKLCWPLSLTIDYGRTPTSVIASGWVYARWALPAAIAAALLIGWRRRPALALAGVIFAIGVAPVSGLAMFQMQEISTTADHYLYFSMFGPAIALTWALGRWPGRWLRVCVAAAIVAFAALSYRQCTYWQTAVSLVQHAVEANPESVIAQNNFAAMELKRTVPRLDAVERAANRALALKPNNFYAMQTYAIVQAKFGRAPEAIAAFDRLWQRCEKLEIDASYKLDVAGVAFEWMKALNEPEQATLWADRQLALDPTSYTAKANVAVARRMLDAKRAALAASRPATQASR